MTHIHLDHAGGVGDVARAFPNATVYVHEKGARHLVDPTRLIDSASRVYGPLLDSLYGRLDPTAARAHPRARRRRGDPRLAGPRPHHRRLARARQAPSGPARLGQRRALRRRRRGGAPARRRGAAPVDARRPTSTSTSPSRRCTASRRAGPPGWPWPTTACCPTPPPSWPRPRRPCGVGPAWPNRRGAPARTSRRPSTPPSPRTSPDVDAVHREKLDTLNGVHSNAAGFRRWLDTRAETAPPV